MNKPDRIVTTIIRGHPDDGTQYSREQNLEMTIVIRLMEEEYAKRRSQNKDPGTHPRIWEVVAKQLYDQGYGGTVIHNAMVHLWKEEIPAWLHGYSPTKEK